MREVYEGSKKRLGTFVSDVTSFVLRFLGESRLLLITSSKFNQSFEEKFEIFVNDVTTIVGVSKLFEAHSILSIPPPL